MKKIILLLVACMLNGILLANHWEPVDPGLYSNATTIIGVIQINGEEQYNDQLELGVFCGDECRGSGFPELFPLTNRFLVNVNVHGENEEELTFRLYDHTMGSELDFTPPASVIFDDDGYGTPIEPYELNFTGEISHVSPNPIVMGLRPNNAWMRPVTFQIYNAGNFSTINSISTDNPYFQIEDVEMPFTIGLYQTLELGLTSGSGEGEEEGHLIINYRDNETMQYDLTAVAYDPAVKDVWETAYEVTSFPFTDSIVVADIPLYNNYYLPPTDVEDGPDAVYKLVFDQDVILNASLTSGENGKMALYPEGFMGVGGPDTENNHTGEVTRGNNRDIVEIGTGTSTTYMVPFNSLYGYSFTEQVFLASEIGTAGNITSISFNLGQSYTSGQTNTIALYMKNVTRATFASYTDVEPVTANDIVYQGQWTIPANTTGWITITLDTPFAYDGVSNLMVAMHESTSGYSTRYFVYTSAANSGISYYSDSYNPDPYNLGSYSGSKVLRSNRSNIQLDITPSNAIGIRNMTVPHGTYYLAASSTSEAWGIEINTDTLDCPVMASQPTPANNNTVSPTAVQLQWALGNWTTEYKLLFGEDPNNMTTALVDWTRDLVESYLLTGLLNNTNYYWQVVERNDGCPEGVEGSVWSFYTQLDAPNLYSNATQLFNDETLLLSWEPIADTGIIAYNIYQDDELIASTTDNTFAVTDLVYNMEGYNFYLTAQYAGGESNPSNSITVWVSGYGDLNGHVYEQDGTTGIAGVTITMVGQDEFGVSHTYNFQTNSYGYYTGHIYAGTYDGSAACNGYQTNNEPVQGNPIAMAYNQTTSPIDYILDEKFNPVCTVIADYYPDSLDSNSPYVKVYWGCGFAGEEIEGFETGDFSKYDWQLDPSYPWTLSDTDPYEGIYCMKSGGAGVANVVSNMTVTVEIPADGEMSFFGKISSENSWDYGYFYIDGFQKGGFSGAGNWVENTYDITAGEHTFQWRYTKDSSVNSNDDCFYVDYINFYKHPEPIVVEPGWHTYILGDFNNAYGSNVGTPRWAYEYPISFTSHYAGYTMTKVSLFSDNMYSAVGGNYTCVIYVGGDEPMVGTPVSTITVDVPQNVNAWVDYDLTTPVAVTGTEPLWVVWTANTSLNSWPAGCYYDASNTDSYGNWWNAGDSWSHMDGCTWTMRQYFDNRSGSGFYSYSNNAVEVPSMVMGTPVMSVKGAINETLTCANPNIVMGATNEGGNTRAFANYRVYRTNAYNNGPYTVENTVLLADNIIDTVFIDNAWQDVEAGVYKYGVSRVYEGNRDGGNREIVEIGDGTGTTYYFPIDNYFNYSCTEQIYTADEIGVEGTINSISFYYNYGTAYTSSNVSMYMKNVSRSQFESTADYEPIAENDLVWYGDIAPTAEGWYTINLDTPFAYDGTSNLLVAFYDGTSGYPGTSFTWRQTTSPNSANMALRYYSDSYNPDPYDLGTYSGSKTLYTYRGNVQLNIEPFVAPIQGERESVIVWSNVLDKNMYLGEDEVNITVTLNSGDSPEGVLVRFINLNPNEQELYPIDNVVLDATGYYAWDSFRRGNYLLLIDFDGYAAITEEMSIWEPADLNYVLEEITYTISNLYVSSTGWAMWNDDLNGNELPLLDSGRHFEQYQVILTDTEDVVIYEDIITNHYLQLPVENLIEGETYYLKVASEYSSGLSQWYEVDWVYQSCSNFEGVAELYLEMNNDANVLSWTYSDNNGNRTEGSREMWDLLHTFNCSSGSQYGVASDGNYIYTSSWTSSTSSQFYKYDLDGNFVEEFNVDGSGQIRDLTYDGQYFYGVANSSTIYCLDLANHSLVNTITSAYGAQRCCAYDPVRDGFWVVGNWSGNLTLIDRTGAIQFTGPAPTSASGIAYYQDVDNVEHVFCFNNSEGQIYDYDIAMNTISGSVFNFSMTPNATTTSTGGCHVGEYNGKIAFFGDIQQSPNLIGIYELRDASPYLGAMLYRDGELLGFTSETSYTDTSVTGDHEYEIRVVYNGSAGLPNNNIYFSMSCSQLIGGATYEVTVAADPEECGVVTGGGSFINGSSCTVTATTNPGYQFTNWTINGEVVSNEPTYTFFVHEDVTCVAHFNNSQSIPLAAGWNWMNSFIELNGMDALSMLEEGMGEYGIQIQSQDAYVVNYNGFWMGELESLTNEQTYLVQTLADTSITFYGPVAQTSDHPITMSTGWNWIGYPVNTEMSVDEAFTNFMPADGDEVKAQSDYAVYYSGYGWIGDLNTIMPGMGLMYHAANSGTFTYPESTRGDEMAINGTKDGEHWTSDIHAYPTNMTMMAVVELDGEELQSENYELAAFADGEVRGSAKLMYVQPIDRYVAFLTIAGNDPVELHFGLYNEVTGEETFDSDDHLTYTINAIVGNPNEPAVVHFRGTTGLDDIERNLHVYPNPVGRGERICLNLPVGSEVSVETVNALGVVVNVEPSTKAPATIKAPETSGIYTLRITVEGKGTYTRKLVVR